MDLTALPDEGLVAKIQGDSPTAAIAFMELFRRYFPLLKGYVERQGFCLGPLANDAEDVALLTLTRLYQALVQRRLSNLEEKGSVRALLYKAARNQARDAVRQTARRERRIAAATTDLTDLTAPPSRSDPETEVLIKDFREVLLARLQPRERIVVELLADGYTTSEICDRLGLSQPTLWRLRRRVEAIVREMLAR